MFIDVKRKADDSELKDSGYILNVIFF